MTPEEYWAYKAFVRDDVTEEALNSSEIFKAYRQAELKREADLEKISAQEKTAEKDKVLEDFDNFEKKIAASPKLKAKFKEIKSYLDNNPEAAAKVDQKFIDGINMLNLED